MNPSWIDQNSEGFVIEMNKSYFPNEGKDS